MEIFIKGSLTKGRRMDLEFTNGQMVKNMKESGVLEQEMEKEYGKVAGLARFM
jgi:hypothetical protein